MWSSLDIRHCTSLSCKINTSYASLEMKPDGYLYINGNKSSVKVTWSGNYTAPAPTINWVDGK